MHKAKFKYFVLTKSGKIFKTRTFTFREIENGLASDWVNKFSINNHDTKRYQYILMRDNNNVEIYEGSIVNYGRSDDFEGYQAIVKFWEGRFCLFRSDSDNFPSDLDIGTVISHLGLRVVGHKLEKEGYVE